VGNESYFHQHMWDSPQGREIRRLEGDPAAISKRGSEIESLGDRMQRAANTLRLIADEQVGKGDSLKEIKDQAADVHADLKKAGERYAPSGAALKHYGDRLATIQPLLNQAVADAESAWETVRTRAGQVDDADDLPDDEGGGSATREDAVSTATGNLSEAKEAWEVHARAFDRHYNSWESAYDYARGQLQKANEDGVEDGFWDNALPFIEGLVAVLEWVALALVILAVIIGGPLLGVLAAIVAVIALIGTVILAAKGRKGLKDIAFAVLGVIPFGKLASFGRLASLARPGARFPMLSGLRNFFAGADDVVSLRRHLGAIDDLAARAWNSTTRGQPFNAITGGSRFIQRVISGAPYVRQNVVLGPRSGEMAVARFVGFGDSLAGITDAQRIQSFAQGMNTLMGQANFAADKLSNAKAEARVDSWR
jgi:hypothetical protein